MPRIWEVLKAKYQKERAIAAQKALENAEDRKSFSMNASNKLWLIVGLGNFGPEYEETRHNCGFRTLDNVAKLLFETIGSPRHRFKGVVREAEYEGNKLLLLWPYTYMNASGESISEAMHWYGIDESRLIVIYDDSDLDVGMIRIRTKGSAGSHNGMKSVLLNTETDEFPRVRIGIGKKPEYFDMINFVLGKFSPEEKEIISAAEQRGAEAVLSIVKNGGERTMSEFNSSRKAKTKPSIPSTGSDQTAEDPAEGAEDNIT